MTAKLSPIDGVARTPEMERRINELLAIAFRDETGKAALRYLRSITVDSVSGPQISDTELRHREGMRFLVAIIEQRIAQHQASALKAASKLKETTDE